MNVLKTNKKQHSLLQMNEKAVTSYSPGRINIIGGHTDYNDGLVLPAAINKGVTFRISKNETKHCVNVTAIDLNQRFSFNLDNDRLIETNWRSYILGVVRELQKIGCQIEGFDSQFQGDIPIGSGLSSSAALECSLAFGLNQLFDLQLDKWQIIKACQMAEHNYVGTKCGIMDQFASVMGKADHVMLLDCRSLDFEYYPCDLGYYEFLLLNTNVTHNLASSEYNKRREECEEGLFIIQKANDENKEIKSLRDVTHEHLKESKSKMPKHIYNRCLHIVSENIRTDLASAAFKINDLSTVGKLMYNTHHSLSIRYEVSCPELDFLVEATKENPNILGSRMMGGGFGGCTLNLIRKDKIDDFVSAVSKDYNKNFAIELSSQRVTIGDGARIIS